MAADGRIIAAITAETLSGGPLSMIAARRIVSIAEVQDTVARAFHLSRADLLSRTRRQHVVYARHVAMYLSRELAGNTNDGEESARARRGFSFPRIGKAFGRNHSSVIHACNAIGRRRRLDTGFAELLRTLAREVSNRADGGLLGVINGVTSATNQPRIPADELPRNAAADRALNDAVGRRRTSAHARPRCATAN